MQLGTEEQRWTVSEDERRRFEEDYRCWIRLLSRDAACRLFALQKPLQNEVLRSYHDFRDPGLVYRELSQAERIRGLARERISSFIVIETDAIIISPSISSPLAGAMDYAVAMNRRLFCQKKWYPIISLHSGYIRQSSDRILAFALEHEFEMSRIYQEIFSSPQPAHRRLSSEEKHEIMATALETSKTKLTITPDELLEDEQLMHQLAFTSPLLPKPYAEMAMLHYLKANLPCLEPRGTGSSSPEEEAFGEELAAEFAGWSQFSKETYDLFVREIAANLRDANRGYA
jgi:hypothetical protein